MNARKCNMLLLIVGFFITSAVLTTAMSPALMLTQYIKANHIELARNVSAVDSRYFRNVSSHTGFFTVDERYNSNIFFWYFPIVGKPLDKTPWIVWLQGGPGASSIAGLFDEIGPFMYADKNLKLRESSWTKEYSVLFIDNPIGAGYSFTDSEDGFITDMPSCATHLYKVLQQFLTIFPEHKRAPLFLAGESYAGRYLPALGLKILDQDIELGPLNVNLQGIMMGNPVINRNAISDYRGIYQQWGLIDSQGAQAVKDLQDQFNKAIADGNAAKASEFRDKLLDRLSYISMQMQNFNLLADNLESKLTSFVEYITHPKVAEAIHVGNVKFTFSNSSVHNKLVPDFLGNVGGEIERLLEHYRVMIYCGQLDLTAPCVPSAQDRRKNWHWSKRDAFLRAPRVPWWYQNTVAGYVKSGGHFTEVLVRGAGHLVPMDKPAELLHLISYFIRGLDIPLPPNYEINKEYTPELNEKADPEETATSPSDSGTKVAMGISIFINIMLVIGLLAGIVYVLRWRRRTEMFMYNNVEETSIAGVSLAMS